MPSNLPWPHFVHSPSTSSTIGKNVLSAASVRRFSFSPGFFLCGNALGFPTGLLVFHVLLLYATRRMFWRIWGHYVSMASSFPRQLFPHWFCRQCNLGGASRSCCHNRGLHGLGLSRGWLYLGDGTLSMASRIGQRSAPNAKVVRYVWVVFGQMRKCRHTST